MSSQKRIFIIGIWIASVCGWMNYGWAEDRAKLLETRSDIADAGIALTERSQHSLDMAFFHFAEDRTGWVAIHQMLRAAQRGAKVRLIIDGGIRQRELKRSTIAYLQENGVEIRIFHERKLFKPFSWHNQRLHDKMVLSDGRAAIFPTGNIKDNYYTHKPLIPGMAHHRFNDVALYVEGDVVQEAQSYFEELWKSGEVESPTSRKISVSERQNITKQLELYSRVSRAWIHGGRTARDIQKALDDLIPVEEARFFHDPIGQKGKIAGAEVPILELIRTAKTELLIENPYVVLTPPFEKAFQEAADKKVQTTLMTNSPHGSDQMTTAYRYEAERHKFPGMGESAMIVERNASEGMQHAKVFAKDGEYMIVTSMNLDPRSLNLNNEIGISFRSRQLVTQLRDRIEKLKETSTIYRGENNAKLDAKLSIPRSIQRCSLLLLGAVTRSQL